MLGGIDLTTLGVLLLAAFGPVQWQWVPRHRNTEADALARAALGMAPKGAAR